MLYRVDELVTYAFQLHGAMGQQLVLQASHLCCELLVGDGAIKPAAKVTAFEMVLECSLIEMPYCSAEVAHRRGGSDNLSVGDVEVEAPLLRQADIGILVAVSYVGGLTICDGEPTIRPGAETYGRPPSENDVCRGFGIGER